MKHFGLDVSMNKEKGGIEGMHLSWELKLDRTKRVGMHLSWQLEPVLNLLKMNFMSLYKSFEIMSYCFLFLPHALFWGCLIRLRH